MASGYLGVPLVGKATAGVQSIISTFQTSELSFFDEERWSEGQIARNLDDNALDKKIDAMKRVLVVCFVYDNVVRPH